MVLPTNLYNYFNQGRENLEMLSSLMNPYAKWMQSPNIPKNIHLPIALENIEAVRECEPTVNEWFDQLESNNRKLHTKVPLFFPIYYHNSNFFSSIHKGEKKWTEALLSHEDKMFNLYSDNSKQKAILDFTISATNKFPKIYNHKIFHLYKEKKSEIYSSLFKNTSSAGLHIYSIILDKNILILRNLGYEWCCLYCPLKDTICLWEDGTDVGSIMTNENISIDIEEILNTKMDLYSDRTKSINISSNETNLKKLRELGKKTMIDLKKEADDKGINNKNIKKDELIKTLLSNFMGDT